ncbi:hypothetical protein ESP57_03000 [Agromyces fucosus]|uniref:Uncharacterized protein n=1 Tax=Agromyces fucosus TaxID=41985 RepID=A0A4Q2JR63_9MICO|nr:MULTISPECIES: hypothetical protein [Agromyces]KQZ08510.1 hypothetical protein ASD23_08820 [Agromyces sp. Root1464]RXZ50785.1 hypothetical protein ESP57_03000 [Agromyces fucosus]
MAQQLTLADSLSLGDLHTYLQRAGRVEDGSVRLIAGSGILAVYTAILYPRGILDESPTVLGLRTFALADDEEFDSVVPMRSLVERIVRARGELGEDDDSRPVSMSRPPEVNTVTWAGISPPRGGWRPLGTTDAATLEAAARAGIDEVAEAIPAGTGEQLVQRVRSEVWGRGVEGAEYIPTGAAFAAYSLGFLGDDEVKLFETGPWTRLSSRRGHVLVRRKPWTLKA